LEEQDFSSLFLLITDWSTASISADLVLFRRFGLDDSRYWLGNSGLGIGSFAGLLHS
jgi:hypothetical protein